MQYAIAGGVCTPARSKLDPVMKAINVCWEIQNRDAYIFNEGKIEAVLCENSREAAVFHRLLPMRPAGTGGLQDDGVKLGRSPAQLFSRNTWTFKASCSVH